MDDVELFIPIAGMIDKVKELQRLEKELKKLDKEICFLKNKLENSDFKQKAPADIINKETSKLEQSEINKAKLLKQQHLIEQL